MALNFDNIPEQTPTRTKKKAWETFEDAFLLWASKSSIESSDIAKKLNRSLTATEQRLYKIRDNEDPLEAQVAKFNNLQAHYLEGDY